MAIGLVKTVVWDAADINGLADFYANLAGLEQTYGDDEWITLTSPDGWRFGVQHAPDHVPPQWPDPAYPQQVHVDLRAADIEAEADRAEKLGARRLGRHEGWIVLADPAGHPFCLCESDVTGVKFGGTSLDTEDAAGLARFYASLLGLETKWEGDEGVLITADGRESLFFQQIAEHRRPQWPDPAHPQQMHLDILVDDVAAAEPETLKLGATRLPGEGDNWRVYADPAGHPFCLIWNVA